MISPEYAAGFFDGEGCIGLTVVGRAKTVALRVQIVNTNADILALFNLQFGGFVSSRQNGPDHWKRFRIWVATGYGAVEFLNFIRPFVRIKKSQLELALEFWEFSHSVGRLESIVSVHADGQCRSSMRRTDTTIAMESYFVDEMHALNRRGVA